MQLYYCDTTAPRKACAVARYLGLPVDFIYLNLEKQEQLSPAFLAINPNGKVPVLVDNGYVLGEANAIMCYLADKAGSELWPTDDRQFEIIHWLSWDADHFTRHAGVLYFEYIIKARFGIGEPAMEAVKEAMANFHRYAMVLEHHLKDRNYLVGNGLSVADFAVAVTLPYADKIGLPLDDFSNIKRWYSHIEGLDAWRVPFPNLVANTAFRHSLVS